MLYTLPLANIINHKPRVYDRESEDKPTHMHVIEKGKGKPSCQEILSLLLYIKITYNHAFPHFLIVQPMK